VSYPFQPLSTRCVSLADIQKDARDRIHKQQGLLAAARLAGSFILSGQGPMAPAP